MRQLTYLRKNTLEWRGIPAPRFDTPCAALIAGWEDAPAAFLERTTKVVVRRTTLSGTAP